METLEEERLSIMQIAQQARNQKAKKNLRNFQERRGGGVRCQFGEMGQGIKRSGGAGQAMSRHDAGREAVE